LKENWIADVADFIKYGVLRELLQDPVVAQSTLGIVWYRTPADNRLPLTQYLQMPPGNVFQQSDPSLFAAMSQLRQLNPLAIGHLHASGVFPPGTSFFDNLLTFAGIGVKDLEARAAQRDQWLAAGLTAVAACNVVFLDPDTGIGSGNVGRTDDKGTEYAFSEEINHFAATPGRTVIVTQFGRPPRLRERHRLIRERLKGLVAANNPSRPTPVGVWHEGAHSVGLLVMPAESHAAAIHHVLGRLCSTAPWSTLLSWL
jgi:hypothetical protein